MAEARNRQHNGHAGNLLAHDAPTGNSGNVRNNGTTSSSISWSTPSGAQPYDYKARDNRAKQFEHTPLASGATMQSYQDSDMFGTKQGSDTVLKSAQVQKDFRARNQNTYARSNVLGNDDAATKMKDGGLHNAVSTRKENNWQSNVFAEAKLDSPTRKKLGRADNGRSNLYGDSHGSNNWEKKQNLAGNLSKKEATRPPQFDEKAAEQRKMNELHGGSYGASKYEPVGRAPASAKVSNGDNRKDRAANQLQSNVLTHADEELRNTRKSDWKNAGGLQAASGNWSAQEHLQKAANKGGVDTYKSKQNQLSSQVLEQTDYAHHAPLQRSKVDMDNIYAKPDPRRQVMEQKQKAQKRTYDPNPVQADPTKNMLKAEANINKHGFNNASLDTHEYAPQAAPAVVCDYAQKQSANIPARTPHQQKKLAMLTSTIGGHDAIKQYDNQNKGEVVDFDLLGLPGTCDEMTVKKTAGMKHIISTELAFDNMKGTCTGTGRIKVRLNEGETQEILRDNLRKAGYIVKTHKENPKKQPHFSQGPKQEAIPNSNSKAHENQTKFSLY